MKNEIDALLCSVFSMYFAMLSEDIIHLSLNFRCEMLYSTYMLGSIHIFHFNIS